MFSDIVQGTGDNNQIKNNKILQKTQQSPPTPTIFPAENKMSSSFTNSKRKL